MKRFWKKRSLEFYRAVFFRRLLPNLRGQPLLFYLVSDGFYCQKQTIHTFFILQELQVRAADIYIYRLFSPNLSFPLCVHFTECLQSSFWHSPALPFFHKAIFGNP